MRRLEIVPHQPGQYVALSTDGLAGEAVVFDIGVVTPAFTGGDGRPHALGMLKLGTVSLPFLMDLSSWSIADYRQQWRGAIDRLARGAPTTALIACYTKDPTRPQTMWALWREGKDVYVQRHAVVPDELDVPFNPYFPESHVGVRVPAETGVPMSEWRVDTVHLVANAFGLRVPLFRH